MSNPWVVALVNPINLAMLALAAGAGLCSAWWMFPVGLVLWAVMVLAIARHPGLRISTTMEARTPLAQRFQVKFDKLERIQVNIYNALAVANPRVKSALEPVVEEVRRVLDQAFEVCQRSSALENYRVVSQANNDLETEWVRLSERIQKATDPALLRELELARDSLEKRLAGQKKSAAQLDRIDAQLTTLINGMDSVYSEVLQLQAQGVDQVIQHRDSLTAALRKQIADLRSLEAGPTP